MRVLFSGAAGDLGQAILQSLKARGAAGFGFDTKPGGENVIIGDTCDEAFLQSLLPRVKPDSVIVNAAIVRPSSFLASSLSDWEEQIRVNLTAAFLLARESAAWMIGAGIAGRILFVGSWAGERPDPKIAAYCASKAGLRMAMKCLAQECAPHGITVLELALGYVDAGLSGRLFKENPALRSACEARAPLGRLITAEEAADEAVRLALEASPHLTGSVVLMDGGLSL